MSFTLTAGYSFKDGEVILPKKLNKMFSGMVIVGALPVPDGTVSAPGFSFASELGTGLYRIGAGDVGFSILGTKRVEITATGLNSTAIGATTPSTGAFTTLSATGDITTGSTTLHKTSVALTNGAGVSLGTISNAPAVGNPTKWIGINDNGTVRYIPAW